MDKASNSKLRLDQRILSTVELINKSINRSKTIVNINQNGSTKRSKKTPLNRKTKKSNKRANSQNYKGKKTIEEDEFNTSFYFNKEKKINENLCGLSRELKTQVSKQFSSMANEVNLEESELNLSNINNSTKKRHEEQQLLPEFVNSVTRRSDNEIKIANSMGSNISLKQDSSMVRFDSTNRLITHYSSHQDMLDSCQQIDNMLKNQFGMDMNDSSHVPLSYHNNPDYTLRSAERQPITVKTIKTEISAKTERIRKKRILYHTNQMNNMKTEGSEFFKKKKRNSQGGLKKRSGKNKSKSPVVMDKIDKLLHEQEHNTKKIRRKSRPKSKGKKKFSNISYRNQSSTSIQRTRNGSIGSNNSRRGYSKPQTVFSTRKNSFGKKPRNSQGSLPDQTNISIRQTLNEKNKIEKFNALKRRAKVSIDKPDEPLVIPSVLSCFHIHFDKCNLSSIYVKPKLFDHNEGENLEQKNTDFEIYDVVHMKTLNGTNEKSSQLMNSSLGSFHNRKPSDVSTYMNATSPSGSVFHQPSSKSISGVRKKKKGINKAKYNISNLAYSNKEVQSNGRTKNGSKKTWKKKIKENKRKRVETVDCKKDFNNCDSFKTFGREFPKRLPKTDSNQIKRNMKHKDDSEDVACEILTCLIFNDLTNTEDNRYYKSSKKEPLNPLAMDFKAQFAKSKEKIYQNKIQSLFGESRNPEELKKEDLDIGSTKDRYNQAYKKLILQKKSKRNPLEELSQNSDKKTPNQKYYRGRESINPNSSSKKREHYRSSLRNYQPQNSSRMDEDLTEEESFHKNLFEREVSKYENIDFLDKSLSGQKSKKNDRSDNENYRSSGKKMNNYQKKLYNVINHKSKNLEKLKKSGGYINKQLFHYEQTNRTQMNNLPVLEKEKSAKLNKINLLPEVDIINHRRPRSQKSTSTINSDVMQMLHQNNSPLTFNKLGSNAALKSLKSEPLNDNFQKTSNISKDEEHLLELSHRCNTAGFQTQREEFEREKNLSSRDEYLNRKNEIQKDLMNKSPENFRFTKVLEENTPQGSSLKKVMTTHLEEDFEAETLRISRAKILEACHPKKLEEIQNKSLRLLEPDYQEDAESLDDNYGQEAYANILYTDDVIFEVQESNMHSSFRDTMGMTKENSPLFKGEDCHAIKNKILSENIAEFDLESENSQPTYHLNLQGSKVKHFTKSFTKNIKCSDKSDSFISKPMGKRSFVSISEVSDMVSFVEKSKTEFVLNVMRIEEVSITEGASASSVDTKVVLNRAKRTNFNLVRDEKKRRLLGEKKNITSIQNTEMFKYLRISKDHKNRMNRIPRRHKNLDLLPGFNDHSNEIDDNTYFEDIVVNDSISNPELIMARNFPKSHFNRAEKADDISSPEVDFFTRNTHISNSIIMIEEVRASLEADKSELFSSRPNTNRTRKKNPLRLKSSSIDSSDHIKSMMSFSSSKKLKTTPIKPLARSSKNRSWDRDSQDPPNSKNNTFFLNTSKVDDESAECSNKKTLNLEKIDTVRIIENFEPIVINSSDHKLIPPKKLKFSNNSPRIIKNLNLKENQPQRPQPNNQPIKLHQNLSLSNRKIDLAYKPQINDISPQINNQNNIKKLKNPLSTKFNMTAYRSTEDNHTLKPQPPSISSGSKVLIREFPEEQRFTHNSTQNFKTISDGVWNSQQYPSPRTKTKEDKENRNYDHYQQNGDHNRKRNSALVPNNQKIYSGRIRTTANPPQTINCNNDPSLQSQKKSDGGSLHFIERGAIHVIEEPDNLSSILQRDFGSIGTPKQNLDPRLKYGSAAFNSMDNEQSNTNFTKSQKSKILIFNF